MMISASICQEDNSEKQEDCTDKKALQVDSETQLVSSQELKSTWTW